MRANSAGAGKYIIPSILLLLIVASAIWLTPVLAKDKKEDRVADSARPKKIIIIDEDGNKTEYNDLDRLPSSLKLTTDLAIASASDVLKMADHVLRDIDVPGITREVTRTLAEVRVNHIAARVDRALSEIDWNEVNYEIDRAMTDVRRELTDPAVREEVKTSLRAAQEDLADASAAVKTDLRKARTELREANEDLARAREMEEKYERSSSSSAGSYEDMLRRMEDDGLIDRFDGFEVSKRGGKLMIDGAVQSDAIYDRYQRFLGEKDFVIEGMDDELTIRIKQ